MEQLAFPIIPVSRSESGFPTVRMLTLARTRLSEFGIEPGPKGATLFPCRRTPLPAAT